VAQVQVRTRRAQRRTPEMPSGATNMSATPKAATSEREVQAVQAWQENAATNHDRRITGTP